MIRSSIQLEITNAIKSSAFASLFLTVFLDSLGYMMVFSYLYFFARGLGATPLIYGAIMAVYAIMQLVFSPILGKISDKFGRRRVLLISTFGTGLSLLIFALSNSIPLLLVARAISGMMGATFPVAQAYVSDTTDRESRLKYMGFLGAGFGLGLAIGPAVGGILSSAFGYAVPSFFASSLGFANFVVTLFRLPESNRQKGEAVKAITERKQTTSRSILTDNKMKFVFGAYFSFFVAFLVMSTTYTPWASARLGFGPMMVGLSLFYIGILLVVIQGIIIPRISKKISPGPLLMFGLTTMALGLGLLGITSGLSTLIPAATLLATGYGLTIPALSTMISIRALPNTQGAAFGVAQSLQGGAQVISPILGNTIFALGIGFGIVGLSFFAAMMIITSTMVLGIVLVPGGRLSRLP
jgi:DHA1 family tetracycline resistance protein-like MFS transporter